MKKIYILMLLSSSFLSAQIAISSNPSFEIHPKAAIHIDEGNNVVEFPQVTLNSINDKSTVTDPQVGLMVYNISDSEKPGRGFCYWDGDKWVNYSETKAAVANNITTEVSINSLGYNPTGKSVDALQSFTINGTNNRNITFTKVGCVKWKSNDNEVYKGTKDAEQLISLNGNDHTYCGYTSNVALDWGESFKGAKNLNGYLVTITSKKEWEFIVNSFYKNKNYYYENGQIQVENLNFRSSIPDSRRVWIGYNKLNVVGFHQQFGWITGEVSEMDWFNGTRYSNFSVGEPNDSGGIEGCSHIHNFTDSKVNSDLNKLSWNDTPCDIGSTTEHRAVAPIFHIFEFNQ